MLVFGTNELRIQARVREPYHETPRAYFSRWWHSDLAAGGARAAVGKTGDRFPKHLLTRPACSVRGRVQRGIEATRLYRGPEFGNRVPMGGRALRATTAWRPTSSAARST